MSISCVVCKGSSQCSRCEIKQLKNIIEKQNYELSYLRKGSNPQLVLKDDYSKYFEIDNKFLPIKYYGEMTDYGFLTITFDPKRFGLFNSPAAEKNYIFKQLINSINNNNILQLTGCFEYQKNGTTHAHLIIKTHYNSKQIEDLFTPHFTDDPKNKYAIKCYPLQKEKCEAYLQKESTEYYRYDKHLNDLDEAEPFSDCKSKCMATVNDLIKIIKMRKASNDVELEKLANRLLKKYELDLTPKQLLFQSI